MFLTIGETVDRQGVRFGEAPIEPDEPVGLGEAAAARLWLAAQGCR